MERFVIIDNGHGIDTPGKCSPDGRLREWQWTRCLAGRLAFLLKQRGIGSAFLVEGDTDIPLSERCRRANIIAASHPNAILISLHSNASGNGEEWKVASGWSAFVAPNASNKSHALASELFRCAQKADILGNRATPPEGYNIANLAICRDTRCPAVLTENMFHDNRTDVDFMLSERGIDILAGVHADGIINYFEARL